MFRFLKTIIVCASLLIAVQVDAKTKTQPNTPNTNALDSSIVRGIQAKAIAVKLSPGSNVRVISNNGVVTIEGVINTSNDATKLTEISQSVKGVKSVDTSRLSVKGSSQPITDSLTTAKVKGLYTREKLFGDKEIEVIGVEVKTTDGVVFLTGTVDTKAEADNAVKLAKTVSGVKKVNSALEVKKPNSNN